MSQPAIKVMLVDDSALVRQCFTEIFKLADDIALIDVAPDPYIAAQKMRKRAPDVLLLDVEMPRMDGLTFLRKLMEQHPLPVVICSTLVGDGSDSRIRALEAGAVDIIVKPTVALKEFVSAEHEHIFDIIRAAAQANVRQLSKKKATKQKLSADAVVSRGQTHKAMAETTEKIILIGASTGGTEAVRSVLESMPLDCPGIAVVQHMPEGFTRSFANRLNQICRITVKEASDNESIIKGHAYIAPGNQHMLIKRSGARYFISLKEGPPVSRHRPSVDVLMRSAANVAGSNCAAVILTGMGDDGAKGLLELREAGGKTYSQNEATCVVYGMPRAAHELGASLSELPLEKVASTLLNATGYSIRSRK
ncbi:chemotaxis response regulator protein-glutamate methylesterase [Aestuariibacter sp. AA17]|uniref:Protein-glutamate methylesterase/protein-glutamine glutaminase n=1 Tax=Fluctibacter corallii TaxID=2984329 RepID=A0ABT3ACR0_9ALTE|nr:chemotaxis response regulator protein-glutamate methylesterase [Aestuariibacter sp. AA17]MCV2886443.1 chemotaxis response regulator protein-glutamate methylesterase [Aestuariibacter sp. AA17]